MIRTYGWALLWVVCLVARGCDSCSSKLGRLGRLGSGTSRMSSSIGKVSSSSSKLSSATILKSEFKIPSSFHARFPEAPPPYPGLSSSHGALPPYPGLPSDHLVYPGRSRLGPPPPYPGLSHGNYERPPPYPGLGHSSSGALPPYPGLPSDHPVYPGRSRLGPPPPYPGLEPSYPGLGYSSSGSLPSNPGLPGHPGSGSSKLGPSLYPNLNHGNYGPSFPRLRHSHGPLQSYPGLSRENNRLPLLVYPGICQNSYSHFPSYPGILSGQSRQSEQSGQNFGSGLMVGLSLSSLSQNKINHHYYFPNNYIYPSVKPRSEYSVESTDKNGTKSYKTYYGNISCISSYNAERVSQWAKDVLDEFYTQYPNEVIPDINSTSSNLGLNISDIITDSMNFTVVQGETIMNVSMSVTCCGIKQKWTDLNYQMTGQVSGTNCVNQQYVLPLKNLTFVPITTTETESDSTTTTDLYI